MKSRLADALELGLRLFECSRLFLSGECNCFICRLLSRFDCGADRLNRVAIAVLALGVVEGFELTNGFGIMTNVYDPLDYLANALGVALAYVVDVVSPGHLSGSRNFLVGATVPNIPGR